jgi:hypothetical protein
MKTTLQKNLIPKLKVTESAEQAYKRWVRTQGGEKNITVGSAGIFQGKDSYFSKAGKEYCINEGKWWNDN